MRRLRYAISLVYGFALLYLVMVWLGGVLAARPIPREYFAFFGREQLSLALFIVQLGVHALPSICLLGFGLALPAWLAKTEPQRAVLWAVLGAASSYFFWSTVYALGTPGPSSVPWWSLPVLLAPWLGFGLAVFVSTRVQVPGVQGEA